MSDHNEGNRAKGPGRDVSSQKEPTKEPPSDPKNFKRPSAEDGAGRQPPPSRYIQTTEDDKDTTFEKCAVAICWILVAITFPFSLCCCLLVVPEFARVIVLRLGRLRRGLRGPGLVFYLPCIDDITRVDLRTDVTNVRPQDVLTKDSVTITVNAVVYFCIFSPIDSIIQVDDARQATNLIAQVTLRNIVGSKSLHVLLTSRQQLSREIQQAVAGITARWGVRVERVDVMDIILPSSLERSLASEAEAVREARAKIILAEGELKASKALKEASDVMSENRITLQLRHLQVLSSIASERRVRIIYPIPLEIMEPFMTGKDTQQDDGGGSGPGGSKDARKEGGGPAGGGILSNFFFDSKDEDHKPNGTDEPGSSKPLRTDPTDDLLVNQNTDGNLKEKTEENNQRPTYVAFDMETSNRNFTKFSSNDDSAKTNQKRKTPQQPGGSNTRPGVYGPAFLSGLPANSLVISRRTGKLLAAGQWKGQA
ncbi:band 7 protein AGAP004871 isoform X1 [Drosophila elegans]|uniref:band 7 protein AGAP004871 isoform X1 n=1 Tax=Drosophila elegans TaxID=30023 RepID=UPI001BC86A54|nr:band 7 protein AGAP004871 isoform X1 [Drosophila elegans]